MGKKFSPDQIAEFKDELLTWMVEERRLVGAYCRQKGKPAVRTVYEWLQDDLAFQERFMEARVICYDQLAEECLELADACGEEKALILKAKLQIETRLKLLAVWDSARFGEKILFRGDPDNPIRILSNDEAMQQIMSLIATAKQRQLQAADNRLNGNSAN